MSEVNDFFRYTGKVLSPNEAENFNFNIKKSVQAVKKTGQKFVKAAGQFAKKVGGTIGKASPVKLALNMLNKKKPQLVEYANKDLGLNLNTNMSITKIAVAIANRRNKMRKNFDGFSDIRNGFNFSFDEYTEEDVEKSYNFIDPVTLGAIVTVVSAIIKKIGNKKVEAGDVDGVDEKQLDDSEITIKSGGKELQVSTDGLGNITNTSLKTPTLNIESKNNTYKNAIKWIAIGVGGIIVILVIRHLAKK